MEVLEELLAVVELPEVNSRILVLGVKLLLVVVGEGEAALKERFVRI